MRKILAMAGVMVLTSSMSYAQDSPDLSAGSQALLFSFNGLSFISAGTFDGGAGYKYFISDGTAVRASVGFSMDSADLPANPGAGQTGTDGSLDGTALSLAAALERHMGMGRVSPYIGAGAMFQTQSTESKNAVIAPAAQTTIKNSAGGLNVGSNFYQGGNTFGVFGLIGFEFFLRDQVSLSGEYRAGYNHTSFKDQQIITGATTTTTKVGSGNNFGITSQGLLTLAVYF